MSIVAKYMAEMIIDYIQGREHFRYVESEQYGVAGWDDIVVEHHSHECEHIQIKRQESDFDKINPIIRGKKPEDREVSLKSVQNLMKLLQI